MGMSVRSDASEDDLRIIGQSLTNNTSLEAISLPRQSPSQTRNGYAELVRGLGYNTTLRSLEFNSSSYPDTPHYQAAFEQAIERNYGLGYIRFQVGCPTPLVHTICRLNQVGRRYMLADPTSRVMGVDVWSRMFYDLDCLYYHLHENPSICNLNAVCKDVATSPA